MVVGNCRFDPVRDIAPVSQTGFIDLLSAFSTGVVPSVAPDADTDYNGIEDPQSILGKPTDVFEAMEMQSRINSYSPPSDDNKD